MNYSYHYTYKITFEDGRFYFGAHSTNNLSDGYTGSPRSSKTKWRWDFFDWELTILEFHDTRKNSHLVENRLIKHFISDPMCLNKMWGQNPGHQPPAGQWQIPVIVYNPGSDEIFYHPHAKQASRCHNLHASHLAAVCKKKRKTVCGWEAAYQ